ncbi:MAG: hypothetical protein EBX52_08460 [Proteobacteria bacterium]|nr:hypothetical protein [Pseudomonadota bacterium]
MKRNLPVAVWMMVTVLAGCAQADRANTHLGSMDDTSKAMLDELKKTQQTFDAAAKQVEAIATALTAIKDMGLDVMNLMKTAFAKKPAGGSDDIGAVLGEPVPAVQPVEEANEI